MSTLAYPVIGTPQLHVGSRADLASDFDEFRTRTMQGPIRVREGTLDILAIGAKRPGRGHCSAFIADAKEHYARIRFLHVMNNHMARILEKRGFSRGVLYEDGEMIATFEWRRADCALA